MDMIWFILMLGFASAGISNQSPAARTMVEIQGGIYTPLYSLDSQKITVKPFSMDVYPVTNADFLAFVKKYPDWKKSTAKRLYADSNYLRHWASDTEFPQYLSNSPVVNVSWFAAKRYCECEGKRLATTAEWELAAKASPTSKDGSRDTAFRQWLIQVLSKPSGNATPAVGLTPRNYYGVYDLHGLVWEWTYDFNSALTTGESRGNSTLDNSLFCGGGSFASKDVSNYPAFMRFAIRSSVKARYCVPNLGFRCVR